MSFRLFVLDRKWGDGIATVVDGSSSDASGVAGLGSAYIDWPPLSSCSRFPCFEPLSMQLQKYSSFLRQLCAGE